jgi:hypothetical protein
MKIRIGCVVGLLSLVLGLVQLTIAQMPVQTTSALPHVVRFGGTFKDPNGSPLAGIVGVTFALYSEQTGGTALWLETQNVTADSNGHYSVLLGSTTSQGLPESIFTSEQARWVGVQVSGQTEQPRMLLGSAPYALKAGDAETIGGFPPSAFMLAVPGGAATTSSSSGSRSDNGAAPLGGSGTQNFLPLWIDNSGDLGNSILFQSGTSSVGIGTITPAATLDVNGGMIARGPLQLPATGTATAGKGFNSQPFSLQGSSFNGTAAIGPLFQWQTEPSGNNTSGAAGTLNLLYGNGSGSPKETGLNIASTGLITFPTWQTFPGTITTVTAGTGLSETGSGGKITLSINIPFANQFYAQLGAANTFTKSQTVIGNLTLNGTGNGIVFPDGTKQTTAATGGGGTVTSVGSGLGLKGGPITTSGTLAIDTTVVPQLGAANSFAGNQTVNGTLTATTSNPFGLIGTTSSTQTFAAGVEGIATAATGATTGVYGDSQSSAGFGVFAEAFSVTGNNYGVYAQTESPAGYGVYGFVDSDSGTTAGVWGNTSSTTGYGVMGTTNESMGTTTGVFGQSNSPVGLGVFGSNAATTGTAVGVYGTTASSAGFGVEGSVSSPSGYGVYGTNFVTTGTTAGVYGSTASPGGSGVQGANFATSGGYGVFGTGDVGIGGSGPIGVSGVSPSGSGNFSAGITAEAQSTSGVTYGLEALSDSPQGYGVYGLSIGTSFEGQGVVPAGVWGDSSQNDGIVGTSDLGSGAAFFNAISNPFSATIYAENDTESVGGYLFYGTMPKELENAATIIGDPGCGEGSGNMGLQLGQTGMSGCSNYTLIGNNAGSTFVNANSGQTVHIRVANADQLTATSGTVNVNGTFTAGVKKFKIDHPLDPANKYLYHTSVESSEMMNIYTGNITTGADGLATVQLPDWFEALNKDFRYQLTVIGQFAQAIVASEISHHHFSIRTDKPNVKVSWQVTGVRHDAYAMANSIPVEVEKASADRGHYLYPEAFGQPTSARIGYEVPPPASEHVAQNRPPFSHRGNASPMQRRMPLNLPVPPTPKSQPPVPPRPIQPQPPRPKLPPSLHAAGLANKLEGNQK